MTNATKTGTGGYVRGIPLNVTLHAWPVPRSDADIKGYNDTSSGIVKSPESAKNFTHSLHNFNATGYVAIDDYDLLETGFSDVQTFILAGIATVTPLLLAFGTVMGLRYLWKKYFRRKTVGYRGVLQREDNAGKVQSHPVPHELKTSESQFTMSPGDEPTSTSSAQPPTPKSNGSVITMTLRNNHLIVETEETDNTPAGIIIESQGPVTKFVTSISPQDLKLEQTKTNFNKEPSSTSPEGPSNDVLSPTDHGALVHRPPDETEDETDKGSCNTGLSQSDLSESSNESQNPSYQYGNQMGYNSGRFGYPEYSGYSMQEENGKYSHQQGPKDNRISMRSSSVVEPDSQGNQSKPPLLKDVLLSDIQAREKRMEEAEEKEHSEQQELLKNADFSVTGKAAGDTIIEINKSSAALETEQSPTTQLKTYLAEHALKKELCDENIDIATKMKMADGTTILRRNRSGTSREDFWRWPDEPFDEMDSTLAVQQYIQQQIRRDPANIDLILTPPDSQDEGVWKYEHLRQFCMELNGLAVQLQSDCHPDTCNQMTATEQWIFLCAAHKTPKECPAIDYTRHTLDGAACLLNSNKYFPSRVSIKESSVAKLGSVCRRVYRIFSHAYFHHRQIFNEFESQTYLCRRFTIFVTKYNLMSRDNLIVPILEEEGTGESEA